MAAGDATWNPKKGVAYRVTFPILDADGDLVTWAAGLDSEVSKDGGTFADCTNEATEIATSSGVYYLDLTATEMSADTVAVIVKTSSSGAKTTVLVMYPLETSDTPVDVLAISGDSVAADNLEAAADGTGYNLGGGSIVAASVTTRVTANTDQLAGQTVTAAAGVTFPSTVSSLTAANVWQTDISGYTTAGYAGTYLKGAGSSGDPWSTALPGTYGAGTAGYIIGTNLNATITSRMATYTQPTGFLAATFPTTVASPTNITSASGVVLAPTTHTGAVIPRVTLTDTCTTNTDMRGTDGAATAAVWTSTKAGYLDAAVSSRMATFTLPTNFDKTEITANGHVSAAVQSIANNSITASSIQGGAITAEKFAADAIDSNALAASAVTEIAGGVLTTAMTESYRAAGVAPTLAQTAFELLAHMGDSAISGTTKTLKKLDGTTAKTFTLDSSTAPTSITEAT